MTLDQAWQAAIDISNENPIADYSYSRSIEFRHKDKTYFSTFNNETKLWSIPILWNEPTLKVCEICGNKRCAHSVDKKYKCTNSNDPKQTFELIESTSKINHPNHYGGADNPYEAIKVIEAWNVGFNLGNCLKYISRAGKKGDELEDLEKAKWYLEREINKLKNNG
jgi:ribosomal protein L32